MFTRLSSTCESAGELYPANAVCFQWCLKELGALQAHCYSQFLLLRSQTGGPSLSWLLLTFMEILSSAAL